MKLKTLCQTLDLYLSLRDFEDISQNGLQVENEVPTIRKVAFAVDACVQTIEAAAACGAQMLICHHGLFWGRSELLRDQHYQRIKLLLHHNIALYAAHLPLDAHPKVGNNAVLAKRFKLQKTRPWGTFRDQTIGIRGTLPRPLRANTVAKKIQQHLEPFGGQTRLFGDAKRMITEMAIITGDAAQDIRKASRAGIDLLLTGETDHVATLIAREAKTTLICGGHYATEVFGVRALADYLEQHHALHTHWIEAPTYV
ncbi:MAG: Nif3-like dinuclear metal center hexameric protein [Myxococcota bacterium]